MSVADCVYRARANLEKVARVRKARTGGQGLRTG